MRITFFTIPKGFRGLYEIIQKNAILSWMNSCPGCEIILLGDEEGTHKVASEYGLLHVPDVERNEYGKPLIPSVFGQGEKHASNQVLCFINADIILLPSFSGALRYVRRWKKFLMVGARSHIELKKASDFADPHWASILAECSEQYNRNNPINPYGIDYFVFSRGLCRDIPPFEVGRPYWDDWMVYYARSLRVPVIDATQFTMAIHQDHPNTYRMWDVPSVRSLKLAGGQRHVFSLEDSTHILTPRGLYPNFLLSSHLFEILPILHSTLPTRYIHTILYSFIRTLLEIR